MQGPRRGDPRIRTGLAGGAGARAWLRPAWGVGNRVIRREVSRGGRGPRRLGCGLESPGRGIGDDARACAKPDRGSAGSMVSRAGGTAAAGVGVRHRRWRGDTGRRGRSGSGAGSPRTRTGTAAARSRRDSKRGVHPLSRGQSLVELALCAPVILLLTIGAAAAAQVVDALAGLDAATQAAAADASRAPDAAMATSGGQARFASITAGYPLASAHLSLNVGKFSRTDEVVATATATVDISWASLVFPRQLRLESHAAAPLESWRSHRP